MDFLVCVIYEKPESCKISFRGTIISLIYQNVIYATS